MSQPPTGFLPQKAPGHSADINQPITSQVHDTTTDPGFKLTGTWAQVADVRAWEGGYTQSNTTNNTIELTYQGTGCAIRFRADSSSGMAEVSIDGTIIASAVDLYSGIGGYVFSIYGTGLQRASHTLKIRVTGTKNTSSSDTLVKVDGVITNLEQGAHQVFSFSQETIPTIISGGVPFLLILFPIAPLLVTMLLQRIL